MEQLEKKTMIGLLLVALILPLFANEYTLHIVILACFYVILSSSWNLLAGYSGQVSFAHVALSSLGAYTSGLLAIKFGIHPAITIVCGAVVAGIFGAIIGALTLRMSGSYLALATIAFSEIYRIVISLEYENTNGQVGLSVPGLFGEATSKITYYYAAVALVVIIVFIGIQMLVKSDFGLTIRAIREDETAAAAMGAKVVRHKVVVFAISSAIAGLAGAFLAHYTLLVSPQMATITEMGIVISMSVIGGLGTFIGPVLGGISLEIISEYVKEFGNYHLMIFGLILILVMRFAPMGLAGLLFSIPTKLSKEKPVQQIRKEV